MSAGFPSTRTLPMNRRRAARFWTAPALWRFGLGRRRESKAPEDWRSPRRSRVQGGSSPRIASTFWGFFLRLNRSAGLRPGAIRPIVPPPGWRPALQSWSFVRFLAQLIVFFVLIGAFVGTAAENSTESSSIVIGLLLPPEEAAAVSLRQGVLLGVELANEAAGARASVVIRGREGQWGADAVEVARMVTEDGVRGLIAPAGGAPSHLTLQVAGRTAVVQHHVGALEHDFCDTNARMLAVSSPAP